MSHMHTHLHWIFQKGLPYAMKQTTPKWVRPRDRFPYWNIRVGDTVQVITGKEKHKIGKVLSLDKVTNTLKVSGINFKTTIPSKKMRMAMHDTSDKPVYVEGPIHYSNVRLVLNPEAVPPITESTNPDKHYAIVTSPNANTPVITARRLKRVGRLRKIRVLKVGGPPKCLQWTRVARLGKRQIARLMKEADPETVIKEFGGSNLNTIKTHSGTQVKWKTEESSKKEKKEVGEFDTTPGIASQWTFRPHDINVSGLPETLVDELRSARRERRDVLRQASLEAYKARKAEKKKRKKMGKPKSTKIRALA